MLIQIKNRFTDEIIIEGDYKDLREAVEKNKANLSEANLFGADLSGANLSGANLSRANLFGAKIKITQKDEIIKALNIEVLE